MPGIVGIIGFGLPEQRRLQVRQMAQSLMHESFYSLGYFQDEGVGVWTGWATDKASFSRKMPVWNESKDICLIFSGDDFKASERSEALKASGHDFEAGTAEYLVHSYEELGDQCIEDLNGRFCGVIIDLRVQTVLVFNDRYGLGRIYFHERDDGLYFSSEAKALLNILPELRQIDPKSWGDFFSCNCVLQNRSLFSGISLVPGGSLWKAGPGQKLRKRFYFSPDSWENQGFLSGPVYKNKLRETWARILPRYLYDRESVGMSLTGGKDSRMIMAWAHCPPGTLTCYTFNGPYRECWDVKLARRIAKHYRQPFQVINVDESFLKRFPELARRAVYLTDGAMDVSGSAELYINKIAREIAPIRITGNYGQEILYRSVAFKPVSLYKAVFDGEFKKQMGESWQTYSDELTGNRLSFVAFKQVPWFHFSRQAVELSQVLVRSPFLDNDLVALAYQAPSELLNSFDAQLHLISEGDPALGQIRTDQGVRIGPDPGRLNLQKACREFTFKAEYAYDVGMPQWLAKIDGSVRLFHLERMFLGRHKFQHYRVWFRDVLSDYVKDMLLDPRTRNRPYLHGPNVEKMVYAHVKGFGNYTTEINRILTAEIIQREFLD